MTSEAISSVLVDEEPAKPVESISKELQSSSEDNVETESTTVIQKSDTNSTVVSEKENKEVNSNQKPENNLSVPTNQNGFKSWMPHSALNKNSPNYKMLVNDGYVDENGLWKIDEYYCVALGSYYSKELGNIYEIELSSGNVFKVITVDHKADIHTDSTHRYTIANGCISEFIVDRNKLNPRIKSVGSVGILEQFNGTFVRITKLGNLYK